MEVHLHFPMHLEHVVLNEIVGTSNGRGMKWTEHTELIFITKAYVKLQSEDADNMFPYADRFGETSELTHKSEHASSARTGQFWDFVNTAENIPVERQQL